MAGATGVSGSVRAPGEGYQQHIERLLREHRITLAGSSRTGQPPYNRMSAARAKIEARNIGLKGALARIFEREARQGWVSGSQFENVTEQGLLDEIITPLTLGLVHGPGPATTVHPVNPETGAVGTENKASAVESAEQAGNSILNAISSFISSYGIRALEVIGGAILILFGLYTVGKTGLHTA